MLSAADAALLQQLDSCWNVRKPLLERDCKSPDPAVASAAMSALAAGADGAATRVARVRRGKRLLAGNKDNKELEVDKDWEQTIDRRELLSFHRHDALTQRSCSATKRAYYAPEQGHWQGALSSSAPCLASVNTLRSPTPDALMRTAPTMSSVQHRKVPLRRAVSASQPCLVGSDRLAHLPLPRPRGDHVATPFSPVARLHQQSRASGSRAGTTTLASVQTRRVQSRVAMYLLSH